VTLTDRPLAGCIVNLSISESDDSAERGFPSWQVNRVTLQIVAALFGQGASVVFGHDWREDGVMQAVYGFARQVQPPVPLSPTKAVAEAQPLLKKAFGVTFEVRLEQMGSNEHVDSAIESAVFQLCLSKISKCLSGWGLFLLHNSR
jgi:hypothetical protein